MAVKKRKNQSLIDRMEKKFGKYAINNLMKYMLVIYLFGIMISFISMATGIDVYKSFLSLDLDAILHGQVWRIFTFVLSYDKGLGGTGGILEIFFMIITIAFYYYLGSALENTWGAFRFNLYIFSGVIAIMFSSLVTQAILNAILREPVGPGIYNFSGSSEVSCIGFMILLAFSTIYSEEKVLFWMIIPIKIKWLAFFAIGVKVVSFIKEAYTLDITISILGIVMMLVSLINFIVFFISYRKKNRTFAKRRKRNTKMKKFTVVNGGNNNVHKCSVCGKTEKDDDSLEFRYCSRCEGNHEYCMEHLFTHEHIKKIVIDLNKNDDKTKDE